MLSQDDNLSQRVKGLLWSKKSNKTDEMEYFCKMDDKDLYGRMGDFISAVALIGYRSFRDMEKGLLRGGFHIV